MQVYLSISFGNEQSEVIKKKVICLSVEERWEKKRKFERRGLWCITWVLGEVWVMFTWNLPDIPCVFSLLASKLIAAQGMARKANASHATLHHATLHHATPQQQRIFTRTHMQHTHRHTLQHMQNTHLCAVWSRCVCCVEPHIVALAWLWCGGTWWVLRGWEALLRVWRASIFYFKQIFKFFLILISKLKIWIIK